MDRKIDFLIIGAQKSGTTTLHNYLKLHPALYLPDIKETSFFIKNTSYQQGEGFLDKFYKNLGDELLVGGAGVHMMYFPYVAERVYQYNPNAKLISLLRNPIDRAYSAFWFARRNGWESKGTFEEALEEESSRLNGDFTDRAELTYLTHGHYHNQLQRYLEMFHVSSLFVILTEDLRDNADETIRKVISWLGVDSNLVDFDSARRSNKSGMPKLLWLQRILMSRDTWYRKLLRNTVPPDLQYAIQDNIINRLVKINIKPFSYPQMNPATRKRLAEYFAPHNDKLAKLINRDLSHWK